MENIKDFKIKEIEPWRIVFAATSYPDYEMDRTYLVENYHSYPESFLLVRGYHCSCFDFDDTEWDATSYTEEELIKVLEGWKKRGYGSEKIIADLILDYITRR